MTAKIWHIGILFFLLHLTLFSQAGLKKVAYFQLEKNIRLTGSIASISDSTHIITANGGLFSLYPTGWLLKPDSSNLILSYVLRAENNDILFSIFNPESNSASFIWQHSGEEKIRLDTIAKIDSCICFIESFSNRFFISGQKGIKFVLLEITTDELTEVFSSEHFPTGFQLINESTLLVSFYNKILSINKSNGAKLFFEMGTDTLINGLVFTTEKKLFISTLDGIFQIVNGVAVKEIDKISGKLSYQKNRIIVLDQINNSITVLSPEK